MVHAALYHGSCLARRRLNASPLTANGEVKQVTTAILLGAPLCVILGCLYWVMSFYQEQLQLNRELWKKHGVEI